MKEDGQDQSGSGRGKQKSFFVKISKYAVIGFEFPGTVLGGLFLGYLTDIYFDSFPWSMASFTLLALLGASIRLARWTQRFNNEDQ